MSGSWLLLLTLAALALTALLFKTVRNKEDKIRCAEREITLLRNEIADARNAHAELNDRNQLNLKLIAAAEANINDLEMLVKEKCIQFPWLANARADLESDKMFRDAEWLSNKKHPALTAAETLRAYARRIKESEFKFRITKYRIEFYEKLFPWLVEISGDDIEALIEKVTEPRNKNAIIDADDHDDPAKEWLNKNEWATLSVSERNQKALDRWISSRNKSAWEIGREFERFVGFRLESEGFKVEYFGAIKGFEDLGRDIIANRPGDIRVIQCKFWARHKRIHEKHVYQTFGTVVDYAINKNIEIVANQGELFSGVSKLSEITPWLVTSTQLSPRAHEAAKLLGVKIVENVEIGNYPRIKCNISYRGGEKIYHLPFDQNYDRTGIDPGRGEKYVYTVREAENKGFRRAWKWRGN